MRHWVSRLIRVGSSKILPYEKRLVSRVLNSSQISPDKYCRRFEEKFSKIHDVAYSAFVSSGTDALRIALLALKEKYGWKDGDEVIVPSVTFVATVNVVIQCGLTPVLADVSLSDYMLDVSAMRISSKTVGMIVAHLFGQPADMDPLLEFARAHQIKIVEDSCETMFVRYKGHSVGSMGDSGVFSTYACHLISTGVGGFCSTRNPELASLIRSYANHGRDPAYIPGYSKPARLDDFIDKHFKYDRIGYSSRGTELQAALGLGQLKVYRKLLKARQDNAFALTEALSPLEDKLRLPYPCYGREHAWMMYPLMLSEKYSKRKLMIYLAEHGIEARHLMPITNQPCYASLPKAHCPNAEKINHHGFYIGSHPEITQKDIRHIAKTFNNFFRQC